MTNVYPFKPTKAQLQKMKEDDLPSIVDEQLLLAWRDPVAIREAFDEITTRDESIMQILETFTAWNPSYQSRAESFYSKFYDLIHRELFAIAEYRAQKIYDARDPDYYLPDNYE